MDNAEDVEKVWEPLNQVLISWHFFSSQVARKLPNAVLGSFVFWQWVIAWRDEHSRKYGIVGDSGRSHMGQTTSAAGSM